MALSPVRKVIIFYLVDGIELIVFGFPYLNFDGFALSVLLVGSVDKFRICTS